MKTWFTINIRWKIHFLCCSFLWKLFRQLDVIQFRHMKKLFPHLLLNWISFIFFLLDGMLNHFMIRTPCFLIQQFCSMDSQTKRSRMAIVVSCQYNTVGVNNHIRINQFQMPDHDELQYKCMVCLGKLLTSKVIRS